MDKTLRQSILDLLGQLSTPNRPVYLVGGAVRDVLLNRQAHDLDFVVPGEPRPLANEVARRFDGALYMLDEERQTVRVVLDDLPTSTGRPGQRLLIDFASLRGESLEEDLRGRDFTINAMAYDVAQPDRIIDPTGGLADLREKRVRASTDTSLVDDPVRVLRAIRLALLFQFRIAPATINLMRAAAPLLTRVSAERQRDELFRMLDGPQVSLAVRILDQVGALNYVLPELETLKGVEQTAPHVSDVWEHTLRVVQRLEQLFRPLVGAYREESVADLTVGSAVLWLGRYRRMFEEHFRRVIVPDRSLRSLLFLAALYHDIAKPLTRTETSEGSIRFLGHPEQGASIIVQRGRALALSTHELERLETIVRNHMRIHFLTNSFLDDGRKLSRRSIYRFYRSTGEAGVDICLLSLADVRGTYETALPQELWQAELETCRELLDAFWEKNEEIVSPTRLLTGDDIMKAFQLKPGPMVGELIEALREAQATGEVTNKEEALDFLQLWLDRLTGTAMAYQETEE